MYDYIENNELKNVTMSEFIRNLFNEYVKSPSFERERCLYWKHIQTLREVFDSLNKLKVKTIGGTEYKLSPFSYQESYGEQFNYVVGKIETKNGYTNISLKLSKIESLIKINEYCDFSKEEIDNLLNQLADGPEFICKDTTHAVVKFDKAGIKKYEACYKDRPVPTDYNDNTGEYIFDTDINKLFFYLIQFGKHVKIIEPISLKDKLKAFYSEALKSIE